MPLILNADDFGLTPGVNEAVFELAEKGALSSTTVMVNMPFAEAAVDLSGIQGFSVGLHANLTEGRPLLSPDAVPSLVEADGRFFPNSVFRNRLRKGLILQVEVERELRAQFDRLEKILGRKPSHLDSHQNIHKAPQVACAFQALGCDHAPLAARCPARFILVGRANPSVRTSLSRSIARLRVRRTLAEVWLHWLAKRLKKDLVVPAGELHALSFRKLDLLLALSDKRTGKLSDPRVFEIACHPATRCDGLDDSRLRESRIEEYRTMGSDSFIHAVRSAQLISFNQLIEQTP